jgi:hypothetical protein
MRYWLNGKIGIDAGLGMGISSSSSSTDNGVTTTTLSAPSPVGFALHGGLPIALHHAKHYSFLIIPEVTFGFATATQTATGMQDLSLNGVLFQLGCRAGAEIHFGFIGVPELALQATVGVLLDTEFTKASQGITSLSTSSVNFNTTVAGAPWAIFTNTISAIYYL